MRNTKDFLKNSVSITLVLILLAACMSSSNKTLAPEVTTLSPTIQATRQGALVTSLLAEWRVGDVRDMAWSPDSSMFAVNYSLVDGVDLNRVVQAFNVKSLDSMWTAGNSLAMDLVFTPDGQFIVESNVFAPLFYWRSVAQGEVVRQDEVIDINQVKYGDCNGGGQIIIANARENKVLVVDYNDLIGLNTNNTISIRQWDLETGQCQNFMQYQGSFDLFDLNASGRLLAFGGEGANNEVIIWDMDKQMEVCRIPAVDFGRFVPGESENTLAVIREQKTVFFEAATCRKLRELPLAPASGNETYLAFSPDGQWFAIARDSIQIMSVSTGEILARIPFPENAIPVSNKLFLSGIKFSSDGHYLLIAYHLLGSADSDVVQLWQLYQ